MKRPDEHKLADDNCCPTCDHKLNAAMGPNHNREPEPGMWLICIYCAELLMVREERRLRKPTPEELADMRANTFFCDQVERALRLVREKIQERKDEPS
jgi:hypothetical protein